MSKRKNKTFFNMQNDHKYFLMLFSHVFSDKQKKQPHPRSSATSWPSIRDNPLALISAQQMLSAAPVWLKDEEEEGVKCVCERERRGYFCFQRSSASVKNVCLSKTPICASLDLTYFISAEFTDISIQRLPAKHESHLFWQWGLFT